MGNPIFQLTRDFYTLKKEYEINMESILKTLTRQTKDIEQLGKRFNELRDHVEEKDKSSGGE